MLSVRMNPTTQFGVVSYLERTMDCLGKDTKNSLTKDLLEDFKKRGFYLEDLCEDPINDLDDFSRIKARMDNIPVLVEKIKR